MMLEDDSEDSEAEGTSSHSDDSGFYIQEASAKRKVHRKESQEDQIYGSFLGGSDSDETPDGNDIDSDDSDGDGRRRKPAQNNKFSRKNRAGKNTKSFKDSSSRPMIFVSSSSTAIQSESEPKAAEPYGVAVEAQVEVDVTANTVKEMIRDATSANKTNNQVAFGSLSSVLTNESFSNLVSHSIAEEKQKHDAMSEKKNLPTVPLKDIGKWEKHTKGVGRKLLDKFGFKGRLGVNEDGISAAIEVKVRPATMGLGFGDFTESSQLKVFNLSTDALHCNSCTINTKIYYYGARVSLRAHALNLEN